MQKTAIISLLLFMISPVIGVVNSLLHFSRNRTIFYFLLSLLTALITLKNPPAFDAIRYLDMYNSVSVADVLNFSNYLNFYIISYVFKSFGVSFYFIPAFFVFLTVFILLKASDLLFVHFKYSIYIQLFISIGLVVLINPIFVSFVMRGYLATAFFFFGIVHWFFGSKTKSSILLFLSFFCHFSYFFLILVFLISNFFSLGRFSALFLSTIGFLFSKFIIIIFLPYLGFLGFTQHYSSYLVYSQYGDYTANMLLSVYIGYTIKFLILFLAILCKPRNESELKIQNAILFFLVFISFASFSDTAAERFSNMLLILSFFYVAYYSLKYKKNIYFIIVLTCVFLFLCVFDIYMFRKAFLYNDFVKTLFLTPLSLLFYSDFEYKLGLEYLNYDGTWK
ncbi:EpsG family protein [Acinetobacter guillouiae]|uniref:EpsG family protein n=1 Tax=Acinetobacter guillouiae TaxID=106649 RepID=UPI003341973A